jgi:hypothetical protein
MKDTPFGDFLKTGFMRGKPFLGKKGFPRAPFQKTPVIFYTQIARLT